MMPQRAWKSLTVFLRLLCCWQSWSQRHLMRPTVLPLYSIPVDSEWQLQHPTYQRLLTGSQSFFGVG